MKKDVLKEILGFSIYLLIILAITYLLIAFVGQRTVVHGESMENMLQDGDNLIVDKWTYRRHDPVRFDIVVFPYKYEKNTFYIKRVIGLPGESVRIDPDGSIYINDELLEEAYGREVIEDAGIAGTTVHLASDEYFVLGDNRNYSSDSRDPGIGPIKRDDIIGKAWMRIYPFDAIGKIQH